MNSDILSNLYKHSVAVIIPSIVEETFGLVAIEAIYHGVPIIASNRGGLEEIVTSSGAGILFDPDSIGSLSKVICDISTNTGLRERLRLNAEKCKLFSKSEYINRYIQLIDGDQYE